MSKLQGVESERDAGDKLPTKEQHRLVSSEISILSIVFLLLLGLKILLVVVVTLFSLYVKSSFLSIVSTSWDSRYFVWIAVHGYLAGDFWQTAQSSYYAYMPMYPILIMFFSYLTNDVLTSAFLLSNMFYFFALIAFYFVARTNVTPNRAVTATFLFGLFPLFATYGFFSYSDTIYLCFSITSWYFFAKQNYAKSSVVAGLATATRALGILLTPIYFALILYGHWKSKLKFQKTMLLLVAPVTAYLLISAYFFELSGNPFAIVAAESQWGVTLSGPLNLMRLLYRPSMFIFPMDFEVSIARLFYLSFFLIAAIAVRKMSRQLAFYSLSFMLFIISLSGNSVFSEPRYALAAWPVFLLFSNVKEREMIVLFAVASLLLTLQSVAYHLTWFWT